MGFHRGDLYACTDIAATTNCYAAAQTYLYNFVFVTAFIAIDPLAHDIVMLNGLLSPLMSIGVFNQSVGDEVLRGIILRKVADNWIPPSE